MSLADWLKNGWLEAHSTDAAETAEGFERVKRDLADAKILALSADWRFTIAYNAALSAASIALAAAGYRPGREAHHHRLIASLALTVKLPPAEVRRLDYYRQKRNVSHYRRSGGVSDAEADEINAFAVGLAERVRDYVTATRPDLMNG